MDMRSELTVRPSIALIVAISNHRHHALRVWAAASWKPSVLWSAHPQIVVSDHVVLPQAVGDASLAETVNVGSADA